MQSPYNYAEQVPFPHIRGRLSTNAIMYDVMLALIPAAAGGIYYFGLRALLLLMIGPASCVLAEYIWQRCNHCTIAVNDYSAVVTGLILVMSLPVSVPIAIVVAGSIFAIIIGKQIFGGIGNNFINPALTGRALIMLLWPRYINVFPPTSQMNTDAVSSATVLSLIKRGEEAVDLMVVDQFIGNVPGCIGETSKILLLAGFVYLIWRKRVSLKSSLSYIAAVLVIVWIFADNNSATAILLPGGVRLFGGDVLTHLLSGGLLMGAFFLLTDYSSSPTRGKICFGVLAGLVTGAIRIWGVYPEGVCFGILTANCFAPLIEEYSKRHVYGN